MNKYIAFVFCILLPLLSLTAQKQFQTNSYARTKFCINADWNFIRGEVPKEVTQSGFDDSDWENITIPHTMKLSSNDLDGVKEARNQPTFHRYIGWYRKKMTLDIPEGQKVFLEFEGAHQLSKLWVNGVFVGEHSVSGYSPFHFDITRFLNSNGQENTIVLSVDNRLNKQIPPDGGDMDFIKWSGLYRDVYLVITNPTHLTFNWEKLNAGIFITTPSVKKSSATVQVKATVRNENNQAKNCRVVNYIIDQAGYVVRKTSSEQIIGPQLEHTFVHTTGITKDLHLWSVDDPYLYRVRSEVYVGEQLVDVLENPLGVRKIEFIKGQGMFLNDQLIELVGANRHQAYPFVGDAVANALHRKDALQFKEAGFNVIRLAHYPHDDSFIKACDELGILIMEEAPTWIDMPRGKWFENLIQATRVMIRNHRNHPSIFIWSAGINHRGPVEQLHFAAKEEDPTRHTGSNGSPWTGPRNAGVTDIYTPMDYQNTPVTEQEFSFLCEHGSSDDAYRNQIEVSRSRASANRFGVALWTAHDYFSFSKDWGMQPRRPFSIYRIPNPVMYWYQSEMLSSPMVYIADERAGGYNQVHVFSNCQEVALYNNGELVAKQKPDSDPSREFCHAPSFTFLLKEAKGDLVAKGYINNQEVDSYELRKYGAASQLKVVIEDDGIPFEANGFDYKLARAYILDSEGNHVIGDSSMVSFSVQGPGALIGDAEIGANPNQAYWGTASILVRSSAEAGEIIVTAKAKGLSSSSASIETVPYEVNRTLAEAKPFFDYPRLKVDIGNHQQYGQFEWAMWNDEDTPSSSYQVPEMPGVNIELKVENSDLNWTNTWGMSGNLPYVAMDGVEADEDGTIRLLFKGLEAGTYQLSTYHHSIKKIPIISGSAILIRKPKSYKISVKDGAGEKVVAPALQPSSGNQIDQQYPASATYFLIANGQDPVEVIFRSNNQDVPIFLNGFEFKRI